MCCNCYFEYFEYVLTYWKEYVPNYWRECLIVILFKKQDREDPHNHKGITLLSVIGKLYRSVINNHPLK